MHILLATPLYPPDIAEPAPYIKELARRLSAHHQVTVVAYGRLPEQLEGVRVVAVDKQQPLFLRLFAYTQALWRTARQADVLYAQNGPSVELPVAVVSLLLRRLLLMRFGDMAAHEHAQKHILRRTLERFATRRARMVQHAPSQKPEILPFSPYPAELLATWEASWTDHVAELEQLFIHAS